MNKKKLIAVLAVCLLLLGFGIYRTITVNTTHDHTKDAWRNTVADPGVSVVMPNKYTEDDE